MVNKKEAPQYFYKKLTAKNLITELSALCRISNLSHIPEGNVCL